MSFRTDLLPLPALALLSALFPVQVIADPCDPALLEQARDLAPQVRYRQRKHDTRCEGFYRSRVASSGGLEVVGLLLRPLRFTGDDAVLTIRSAVSDRAVLVRGRLIPSDRYYRLDAELAPGASLRWPLKLLAERGYRAGQVGLYGRLADAPQWLVPLDVHGVQADPASASPRLILRAPLDLSEVRWRWKPAQGDGCPALGDDWAGLGSRRAYRPIVIDLGAAPAAERLCLEVQADAVTGELLDTGGPLRVLLP